MRQGEKATGWSLSNVLSQLRKLGPTLSLVGGIIVVLGIIILVVYATTHVNVHHMVADPSEIAFLPEYTGVYSYIGVLVLWTAGLFGGMTGFILRGNPATRGSGTFLMSLGVLLALLAIDDLFMLHEWAGHLMSETAFAQEREYSRSLLESVVFAVIGLLWLVWVIRFWRRILQTEYLLLVLALVSLGLSVAIDLSAYIFPSLEPESIRMRTTVSVLEEMLKLTGILLMFAYVFRQCMPAIRRLMKAGSLVDDGADRHTSESPEAP